MELMYFLLGFIFASLYNYPLQLFDMLISYLQNKFTLNSAYVQAEIDEISVEKENTNCIGFQYQQEEEYEEVENENVIGFRK